MASKHTRKPSTRLPLTRRTTIGPLDDNDPLLSSVAPVASPAISSVASPSPSVAAIDPESNLRSSALPSPSLVGEAGPTEPDPNAKDLSFLLEPSIYHPLSQLELPAPFRRTFPTIPSSKTPLPQSLSQLDTLLAKCDFLLAAHLAGGILSSGSIKSTDIKTIFRLLGVRFSCLELTGNALLAVRNLKSTSHLPFVLFQEMYTPGVRWIRMSRTITRSCLTDQQYTPNLRLLSQLRRVPCLFHGIYVPS